jgi:diguanylate cyclase (GGDEF)-like protein
MFREARPVCIMSNKQQHIRHKIDNAPLGVKIIVMVCAGALLTWSIAIDLDKKARTNLILQARLISHSINQERLKNLNGNRSDLNSADYIRIKEQLNNIRLSNKACRFLYLMGLNRDGNVFFFVDSQLPSSEHYSPPGFIYEEVPGEYLPAFMAGTETVIGPTTDKWGTQVTALVPINNIETNRLIAVLGMDIEVSDWYKNIIIQSLLPAGLALSIITLIFLFIMLKLKTNELKELINIDPLTTLYSRRRIFEQAEIELNRSNRSGEFLSIIVIDLDNFKRVNDEFGHHVGDIVLQETSSCLKRSLRKTDFVGRIGGEEFIVLLPNTTGKNAANIAEKLRNSIALLKFDSKKCQGLSISASFGVSTIGGKGISFDDLYAQADKALYVSKKEGRNRVSVYSG